MGNGPLGEGTFGLVWRREALRRTWHAAQVHAEVGAGGPRRQGSREARVAMCSQEMAAKIVRKAGWTSVGKGCSLEISLKIFKGDDVCKGLRDGHFPKRSHLLTCFQLSLETV